MFPDTHRQATLWIGPAVCVHNMALRHEMWEREGVDDAAALWREFIMEGIGEDDDIPGSNYLAPVPDSRSHSLLVEGKKFHEELNYSRHAGCNYTSLLVYTIVQPYSMN